MRHGAVGPSRGGGGGGGITHLITLVAELLVVDQAAAPGRPVSVDQEPQVLLGEVDTTDVHRPYERPLGHLQQYYGL